MSQTNSWASQQRRSAGQLTKRLVERPFMLTGVLFIAFLAMLLAGAAFFPPASAADEAAHYVYAAAVVRGEAGTLEPTLPARIANIHDFATCIAFQPAITAACQGYETVAANGEVLTQTNAGLYNPVFYAWAGLGSLIVPTEYGLYVSRALAATVTSVFLAWGVSITKRRSATAWPMAAIALLLTPMTIYVGSVLNPSAWEIATLFAATVAGVELLRARPTSWSEAHAMLTLAGSVLIVTRGLSPLFLAIATVVIVVAFPLSHFLDVLRRRSTWIVVAVLASVAAASVLWVLAHGTHYVGVEQPRTVWDGVMSIPIFYANYYEQITQMYGNLGWLDLRSPQILPSAWVFLMGALIVLAAAVGSRRHRVAIVSAFGVTTLLPGILSGLQWSGLGWQGRYSLPLVAVLLVVSGFALDSRLSSALVEWNEEFSRAARFFQTLFVSFFVAGMTVTLFRVAHRYSVGDSAEWFSPAIWSPPIPGAVLAITFGVGTVVVAWVLRARTSTQTLDRAASSNPTARR